MVNTYRALLYARPVSQSFLPTRSPLSSTSVPGGDWTEPRLLQLDFPRWECWGVGKPGLDPRQFDSGTSTPNSQWTTKTHPVLPAFRGADTANEDEERKHTNQAGFKEAPNVDGVPGSAFCSFYTVCSFRAEFCGCLCVIYSSGK